jgi:hypothetical protein
MSALGSARSVINHSQEQTNPTEVLLAFPTMRSFATPPKEGDEQSVVVAPNTNGDYSCGRSVSSLTTVRVSNVVVVTPPSAPNNKKMADGGNGHPPADNRPLTRAALLRHKEEVLRQRIRDIDADIHRHEEEAAMLSQEDQRGLIRLVEAKRNDRDFLSGHLEFLTSNQRGAASDDAVDEGNDSGRPSQVDE